MQNSIGVDNADPFKLKSTMQNSIEVHNQNSKVHNQNSKVHNQNSIQTKVHNQNSTPLDCSRMSTNGAPSY